jgi:hypothetical protein
MTDNKVVFPELIFIKTTNGHNCRDCSFLDGHCSPQQLKRLTGIDCRDGYIFKKPEVWETCTRNNTNVTDIVRVSGALDKAERPRVIEHFYEKPLDGNHDVLVRSKTETFPVFLKHYEININR